MAVRYAPIKQIIAEDGRVVKRIDRGWDDEFLSVEDAYPGDYYLDAYRTDEYYIDEQDCGSIEHVLEASTHSKRKNSILYDLMN